MRTAFAVGACLLLAHSARADVAAPPPVFNRVAAAETIVAGRVTALEDKDVAAVSFHGGAQKIKYRIALVTVNDPILNAKGLKQVRVGFIPYDGPPVGRPRMYLGQLRSGDEGILFLRKHPAADFYVAPYYYDLLLADWPNYAKEAKEVRQHAKQLEDAPAGLKSKDARQRFQSAALLILKYRTRGPGKAATEELDAAESKLLLKALAEADWAGAIKGEQPNPWTVFSQLGLTAKDGWKPPASATGMQDYVNAAREWLRTNAETYRIRRFVSGKN